MVLVPNDTHYYTQDELQCMNMLKHPVWVFDIDTCSMYWANTAALVVWDASTLNELVLRDFQSDMSEAAISFLKNVKEKIHPNQNETISEQWTFYPRGMNATTIDITCSGIRIMGHSNDNSNNQSSKKMKMMNETDATMDATTTSNATTSTTTNALYVPRIAMLVEAEMLDKKQVIGEHMVRSIEILKHIPIAVSQFTMNGTILLHQNPKASNLFGNHTNNTNTNTNNSTSSNTCTNTNASLSSSTTTTTTTRKRSNSCNTLNDNTSKHGTNNNNTNNNITDRATGNTSNYYNNHDIDDTTSYCDDNQNNQNILLNRFVDIEIGQKAIQMIQNSDDEYNDEVQQYCYYYSNSNHNNNTNNNKSNTSNATSNNNNDNQENHHQQQQKRWFNISLRRARDPVTSNYVILYIAHDISDIVKARKDTLQAKMKSEFLNVMAHEIRTPLHQIIGHVDLIEDSILLSNHNNKNYDTNTNHTSKTNTDTTILEHQSTSSDCNSHITTTNDHSKPSNANHNNTTCMNCTINDKKYTHFNINREHMLGSIQQIQISCSMLISIINDLLDCSKLENGQVQIEYIPFQLHTFIKECIDSMKPQLLGSTCATTISTTTNTNTTPYSITTYNSSNNNNTNNSKKQLNLTYTIDPKCCNYIISDMNRLRQIICNLLSNAIKFSFIGTITITVKPSSSDKSSSISSHSVSSNCDDSTSFHDTTANTTTSPTNNVKDDTRSCQQSLRFEVSDTGIGIDPSEQSVIFERYRQANASVARQFGGTGLGLPICKGLVELLGGSIGLHSTVGVGTTVYFDIPVTIAKQDDKHNKNENQSGSILSYQSTNTATDDPNILLQHPTPTTTTTSSIKSAIPSVDGITNHPIVGLNVLVVEDNLVNQKVIKAMLQRLGHHVTIAENGQVAVNEIRRRQQSQHQSEQQQFFELILMDIQMPVMDGIECTTYIRNVLQYDKDQLPIIGLTAGYQPSDHNYYENEIGMNRCVGKPLPMESLKKAIASCYRPERTTVVTTTTTSTSQTSNTDLSTTENIAL